MNLLQTIKNENNEIDIYTQDLKEIVALSNSSIEQYKEYIKIYGDRTLEELKLETKTYRTDPILLVEKMLKII